MNKKLMIAVLAFTLVGTGFVNLNKAFAQDNDHRSTIIQKIAEKFGLNKVDVQAVFEKHWSERQAQMQVRQEERLTQLVTDGKITEAQKQLILAKHKELQGNRDGLRDWATQNGIDIKYLMGGFGMRKYPKL